MSLSDCIKCYDTPCRCGYNYEDWSLKELTAFINTLIKIYYKKYYKKEPFDMYILKEIVEE